MVPAAETTSAHADNNLYDFYNGSRAGGRERGQERMRWIWEPERRAELPELKTGIKSELDADGEREQIILNDPRELQAYMCNVSPIRLNPPGYLPSRE